MHYQMGGKRRNPEFENTFKNTLKANEVDRGGLEGAEAARAADVPGSAARNLVVLESLAKGLETTQGRWPGRS
ncbi:hypothetical protein PAEPH01_1605 [Pancytospora epiphaga]|nr:hypothetical protein PAEPH01_1605 [Pancytospora epiphaga]